MKQENVILDKSFLFAVKVIKLYRRLCDDKKEYIISKQLLRSATSIGANINEAQAAQSKSDFISKMCIASKEARETKYWLELLMATDLLDKNEVFVANLMCEIDEIIRMLTAIVKTSQTK